MTGLLKFDEPNLLEVTVAKHSANDSVNRAERTADYWVFGGIYRPVYLEAVPQRFIERVAIDARADGQFAMDVFVNGAADGDTLEAQIAELDGQPVGEPFAAPLREVFRRLVWKRGILDGPEGWAFCLLSGLSEWVLADRHRRLWCAACAPSTRESGPSARHSVRPQLNPVGADA